HLPDHGRLRPRHAAARLGGELSQSERTPRAKPPAALGDISQLSPAFHSDTDRMVHRRSGAPALGRLRRAEDGRGHDSLADGAGGDDLAGRLLRPLQLHLPLRRSLHLSLATQRSGGTAGPAARFRKPQSAAVRRRPPPRGQLAATCCRRIAMITFWVFVLALSTLLYVLL